MSWLPTGIDFSTPNAQVGKFVETLLSLNGGNMEDIPPAIRKMAGDPTLDFANTTGFIPSELPDEQKVPKYIKLLAHGGEQTTLVGDPATYTIPNKDVMEYLTMEELEDFAAFMGLAAIAGRSPEIAKRQLPLLLSASQPACDTICQYFGKLPLFSTNPAGDKIYPKFSSACDHPTKMTPLQTSQRFSHNFVAGPMRLIISLTYRITNADSRKFVRALIASKHYHYVPRRLCEFISRKTTMKQAPHFLRLQLSALILLRYLLTYKETAKHVVGNLTGQSVMNVANEFKSGAVSKGFDVTMLSDYFFRAAEFVKCALENGMVKGKGACCAKCKCAIDEKKKFPKGMKLPEATKEVAMSLSKCMGCRCVFFCSTLCQKELWPEHKQLCQAQAGWWLKVMVRNDSRPCYPFAPLTRQSVAVVATKV